MAIDQQWICYIPLNHRHVINTHIIQIVNNVNSSSSWQVSRFNNPHVLSRFSLFKFVEVLLEVSELLWQDVCVSHYVKRISSKLFLHFNQVVAQSVFPCDLVTGWEVIHFLILVQTLIDVGLATWRTPEEIPFMRICVWETISFK
jgi:hypothetical protein